MRRTQLNTSKLGGTGMEITRAGFGAWAIGPYVFTKCSLLDDGTRHVRHVLKRDSVLRLELTDSDVNEIEGR